MMKSKITILSIILTFTITSFLNAQIPSGTLISEKIHSTAVSTHNKIFASVTHPVLVYLPPSYYINTDKRYPVVYYLGGYSEDIYLEYRDRISWSGGYHILYSNNDLVTNGTSKEIIMVIAQGLSEIKGAFYVNSEATSNWEDFIVKDLVNYMDNTYKTIPEASSRALSGLSMGGYGALNLSMKHPDVFSIGYGISSGLFDEMGLEESFIFKDPNTIHSFLNVQKNLALMTREDAHNSFITMIKGLSSLNRFQYAYGLAFSPDTSMNAPYFSYPYSHINEKLVKDSTIWKKWESGYGNLAEKITMYKDSLQKLKGYFFDYGTNDQYTWIPKGNAYFSELLTKHGISHKAFKHNGTHVNKTRERIESFLMPYCDSLLLFDNKNLNREANIIDISVTGFIEIQEAANESKVDTIKILAKDYARIDNLSLKISLSPGAKICPSPLEMRDYTNGAVPYEVISESTLDTVCYYIEVSKSVISSIDDIRKNNTENTIKVYPNPSVNGIVTVEFLPSDTEEYTLTIYDLSLRRITTQEGIRDHIININLSDFDGSVVFAVFTNKHMNICKKIVLIK